MIRDAELHADEDKKKRELVDAKNSAESIINQSEKTLKEYGDKVDSATKDKIQDALAELKRAKDGDNAEIIKQKIEALTQVSQKLGEAMYQQATQDGGQAGGGAAGAGSGAGSSNANKDDDVVDADFEEVGKK